MRETMRIARFCTALIKIEPQIKMMHATAMESRLPILSPVHEAKNEPSRDPPAMEAVMPPCVTELGLEK